MGCAAVIVWQTYYGRLLVHNSNSQFLSISGVSLISKSSLYDGSDIISVKFQSPYGISYLFNFQMCSNEKLWQRRLFFFQWEDEAAEWSEEIFYLVRAESDKTNFIVYLFFLFPKNKLDQKLTSVGYWCPNKGICVWTTCFKPLCGEVTERYSKAKTGTDKMITCDYFYPSKIVTVITICVYYKQVNFNLDICCMAISFICE